MTNDILLLLSHTQREREREREKEREKGGRRAKRAFFCLQGRNKNYIPAGTKGF
jgi:hypothetical protein